MTILRRVFLLWLLMFWQGGFLFYGAVVVTIGSDGCGSDFAQGMITRRVTDWINLSGLIVLLAWTWDLLAAGRPFRKRRWACWAFLIVLLAVLAGLHWRMESLIDAQNYRLVDRTAFRDLHRWYLRVSTAQWLGAVLFTIATLRSWQAADRQVERSDSTARVGLIEEPRT